MTRPALTLFIILAIVPYAYAERVVLINGDQITGEVTEVTSDKIVINADFFGKISVSHAKVSSIDGEDAASYLARHEMVEESKEEPEGGAEWDRAVSLGYSQSGGNTDKNNFNGQIKLNRKTSDNEATLQWRGHYAKSEEVTDVRKFYGLLRYASSFGRDLRWYQFAKFEADQDRFSNIGYRLIPSGGLGYWFADSEDFKAMTEIAVGYEYTEYRDGTDPSAQAILVPRAFLEKLLWSELTFKEDLTLYPSLENFGEFRLRSETALVHPLSEKVSWRVSLIDDYVSDPAGDVKRNDYQLITALDFTF